MKDSTLVKFGKLYHRLRDDNSVNIIFQSQKKTRRMVPARKIFVITAVSSIYGATSEVYTDYIYMHKKGKLYLITSHHCSDNYDVSLSDSQPDIGPGNIKISYEINPECGSGKKHMIKSEISFTEIDFRATITSVPTNDRELVPMFKELVGLKVSLTLGEANRRDDDFICIPRKDFLSAVATLKDKKLNKIWQDYFRDKCLIPLNSACLQLT